MKTTYHYIIYAFPPPNPYTRPQLEFSGEKWESDKKRNKTQQAESWGHARDLSE
jgi:hypothetical protein